MNWRTRSPAKTGKAEDYRRTASFFPRKFRKMDVANQAQRKMLIDTFVNAIFLYDDKVVLTYNFHEGTETISLKNFKSYRSRRFWFGFGFIYRTKKKLGKNAGSFFFVNLRGNGLGRSRNESKSRWGLRTADRSGTSPRESVPASRTKRKSSAERWASFL